MTQTEFPKIFPAIKTKRLTLRQITSGDSAAIFKNFSDPEIAMWFFEQPLTKIEQAEEFVELFNTEFQQGVGLTWVIELKENNQCIGTCGYGAVEFGATGEIGFDLAKGYWGKGLMSESLVSIVDYGFSVLNLLKVEAHTYSSNARAKRLLEKLNFQLEKISVDSHYYFLSRQPKNQSAPR
jgi:ribosomal-protein-alanine N-acetyltransferase